MQPLAWDYYVEAISFRSDAWKKAWHSQIDATNEVLEELGREGWELVSMAPVGGYGGTVSSPMTICMFVFKRPAGLPAPPDDRPPPPS